MGRVQKEWACPQTINYTIERRVRREYKENLGTTSDYFALSNSTAFCPRARGSWTWQPSRAKQPTINGASWPTNWHTGPTALPHSRHRPATGSVPHLHPVCQSRSHSSPQYGAICQRFGLYRRASPSAAGPIEERDPDYAAGARPVHAKAK